MYLLRQLAGLSHYIVVFFILINFILLIYLIYLNRKYITKFFLKIDKKTWALLFLIFIFALTLRIVLPSHHHRMWTDEAVYMEAGKNILQTLHQGNYSRSIGWPFLLSILFGIFGISNWVALYSSTVLGALTIFNIFLLSFIITKQKGLSLIAALVFSLFAAHITWSASAETNVPSLFFITLTLFFCFLYYRYKKISLLWLSLISLSFTIQFRPENYILPILSLFGVVLFNKRFVKKINFRFILPWLVLLILSFPNFITNLNAHTSESFMYNESGGRITGSNFGISNLIYNSINFGKYLFNDTFQPKIFSFLFIAGSIYMLYMKRREAIFLVAWFFSLWFVYFFSWFQTLGGGTHLSAKTRFFMMFYPITVIFMSYGVLLIRNIIPQKIGKLHLNKAVPIIITIMVVLFFIPYSTQSRSMLSNDILYLETKIPELAEKDIPRDCIIIANQPVILSATTDLNILYIGAFLYDPDKFLNSTPCVLFYEDYLCSYLDTGDSFEKCNTIKENYNIEEYKSYRESDIKFTFFKIIGKIE